VFFYKRAQIFVADVWGALGGTGPAEFADIGELTMFADYRVPQLLLHLGVMQYDDALKRRVVARDEIAANSVEEVEIRAATIVAVEQLRAALAARGKPLLSIQVDWSLWQKGEDARESILPHHRTRTIFY